MKDSPGPPRPRKEPWRNSLWITPPRNFKWSSVSPAQTAATKCSSKCFYIRVHLTSEFGPWWSCCPYLDAETPIWICLCSMWTIQLFWDEYTAIDDVHCSSSASLCMQVENNVKVFLCVWYREIASTFARLCQQVDITQKDLENDIQRLTNKIQKLETVQTRSKVLRSVLGSN